MTTTDDATVCAPIETSAIKLEPSEEPAASSSQTIVMDPQILPVIKTEAVNNFPVVPEAVLQKPVMIHQTQQIQQQCQPQQQLQTTDGTFILSTRPIRRFTAGDSMDNKTGKLFFLL